MWDYISNKIQPKKKFFAYSQKSAERLLLLFKEFGINNALILRVLKMQGFKCFSFYWICAIEMVSIVMTFI